MIAGTFAPKHPEHAEEDNRVTAPGQLARIGNQIAEEVTMRCRSAERSTCQLFRPRREQAAGGE